MTDARDSLNFHQPCMMGPTPGGMGTADAAGASSAAGTVAIQDGPWPLFKRSLVAAFERSVTDRLRLRRGLADDSKS